MSNESNFLSHHERKRLEYLYSNFHYLNEREQLEYNYLLKKSQGAYEEAEALQPEVDATEEVQGEIAEPIGDLPVYLKSGCCFSTNDFNFSHSLSDILQLTPFACAWK